MADRLQFADKPLLMAELDRQVRIERRLFERDPEYGTNVAEWELFAHPWARVRDVLPGRAMESEAAELLVAARRCRVRLRWVEGLTSDMRIVVDHGRATERILQMISPPAEIGRRRGWECLCEDYSTEGAAP